MSRHAPLRILAETAYPASVASARIRLDSFAPFLQEHNLRLDHRPCLSDSDYRTLSSAAPAVHKGAILARSGLRTYLPRPDHELLLVHRLRSLTPLPGLDPPRRLDAYDLDDALFLGSAASVNRRFQWAKQEASRCIKYLRRARLVIAGNQYLAGRASAYARRVEVVPSCVDPEGQPLHDHLEQEVVTIGWIGSHTTSAYLKPIIPVVDELNRAGLPVRLLLVGADPAIRADWITHHPWSLATEAADLASFDVGVMPLPDTEWARGKCGYKLLQYFAAGVPAVASPVGVNTSIVGSERGYLATSHSDWNFFLRTLVASVEERRERGRAARAFVEREYSYQRWAPELARMLTSLAN